MLSLSASVNGALNNRILRICLEGCNRWLYHCPIKLWLIYTTPHSNTNFLQIKASDPQQFDSKSTAPGGCLLGSWWGRMLTVCLPYSQRFAISPIDQRSERSYSADKISDNIWNFTLYIKVVFVFKRVCISCDLRDAASLLIYSFRKLGNIYQ